MDGFLKSAEIERIGREVYLLPDSSGLYPVGRGCHVPCQAVFHDFGFRDGWRLPAGDYVAAHALREPEVPAEGDSASGMAADWASIVRVILFDFRHANGNSKGDCALYPAAPIGVISSNVHRDQVKGVRLLSVRLYVAPHTVGAVSNRTGHQPNWG